MSTSTTVSAGAHSATHNSAHVRPKKYFARYQEPLAEMPNLVESQLTSFTWLIEHGITNLLKEFSPIKDYAEKKFELSFGKIELMYPKYNEHYAKDNKMNFEGQIKITVKLKNKTLNIEKEQEIVDKMSQLENMIIPTSFDYDKVSALSNEALQKFKKIKPGTLGQASRISGVNPSDVQILMVFMGR